MARADLSKEDIYEICSAMCDYLDLHPSDDSDEMIKTILDESFDPINSQAMIHKIKDLMTRFYRGFLETDFRYGYEDQESALADYVDILFKNELILKFLDRRGIKSLYHFTRSENLKSILQYGFVPIDRFDEYSINAKRNDPIRLDGMSHCTSFSISFPNYKLFYKFRESHVEKSWVVIEIDPRILVSPYNNCYFFADNAAAINQRGKELTGVEPLQEMFCASLTNKSGDVINRAGLKGVSMNFTTNPQAEVMVDGIIKPQYIRKLHFLTKMDKYKYLDASLKDSRGIVDSELTPDLFDRRADWQSWSND